MAAWLLKSRLRGPSRFCLRRWQSPSRTPEHFIIIAFDPEVAANAKKALPSCKVLRLASYEPRKASHRIDELIRVSLAAGLDGLNLSRKWPIDEAFVRKVHEAGLALYVLDGGRWSRGRRLRDAGVDGITTNRPRLAEGTGWSGVIEIRG